MDDYLSKPIDREQLFAKLCKWILGTKTPQRSKMPGETDEQAKAAQEIDWEESTALKRMGGETTELIALIELFLEDMPERIHDLQQALEKKETAAIQRAVHSIKGVAANISGLHLQSLATQMDMLAKAGNIDRVQENFPALIKSNEQLSLLLKQYIDEHKKSESTQQVLTNEQIHALLQVFRKKLQQGDYIDNNELEPFKSASYDVEIQKLLKQLMEQIVQFDSPAAIQTIQSIETRLNVNIRYEKKENP